MMMRLRCGRGIVNSKARRQTFSFFPARLAKTALFWLLFVAARPVFALDPRLSITQYLHTTWTQEEGIDLPAINALAQTRDGYLWLATRAGLVRFDGMRFVRWEPASPDRLPDEIRELLAAPDGALWVRTVSTISRLEAGRLRRYPQADTWLAGHNRALSASHDGRLWLVRSGEPAGVATLRPDGTFQTYGPADGLPARVQNIFEDRASRLWLATERELCQWTPGSPPECRAAPLVGMLAIPPHLAADLLVGPQAAALSHGVSDPLLTPRCAGLDGDGNVWVGTTGQGLLRSTQGLRQRFTHNQGLSSDYVRAILEDREHNLWVATARGLDRFRNPQVLRVSSADGLSSDLVTAVEAGREGAWVGTYGRGINRITGNRAVPYNVPSLPARAIIIALHEDSGGRLWISTDTGCGYLEHNRFVEIRAPDGTPLSPFQIVSDTNQVWMVDRRHGLLTVHGRTAEPAAIPELPRRPVYQIQPDRDGGLWIGYTDGQISLVKNGAVRSFGKGDGLPAAAVQDIAQDHAGVVWVGTANGLSRYRNGRWTTWTTALGVPEGGVWGIQEDTQNALWFMTAQGLSRLKLENLERVPDGAPGKLEFPQYGQSDGIRLAARPAMVNPRSARSADGRLWISTDDGVAIVDPALVRANQVPPPVTIEELVVDGRPLDLASGLPLSFRGRQLHITYTALSLMVPEQVRFRYRLEGLDPEWTEPVARRTVDFVNLAPGDYRFRVIARNNDGIWSPADAALAFRIEPYFYQTRLFLASCLLTVGLIGWAVHRLRIRELMARYEATTQERIRLTRELHDSLLQGFVGVVYQLEAVARLFDHDPPKGKERLDRAIVQAERAVTEARQTMLAMRLPELEQKTLPDALSSTARGLTEGTDIHFRMEVKGNVRQLPYEAQANIFLIGREAITNSVNHARPSSIYAALIYAAKQVRLTVRDNGNGFDPEEAGDKRGHWGMAGMRERAGQIGATFSVSSSPGNGTIVEVVLPCKG